MKSRQYSEVTKAYAQALFNASKKRGTLERVAAEAAEVASLDETHPRLRIFMEGPQFSTEAKLKMLEKVLGGKLDPVLYKALTLIILRDRYVELDDILHLLGELVETAQGIFPAHVTTARPLNDADRTRLVKQLEAFTGSTLRIKWEIDPKLIGGVVFRFRDLLLDSSLASGLNRLRRQLMHTQVIEPGAA